MKSRFKLTVLLAGLLACSACRVSQDPPVAAGSSSRSPNGLTGESAGVASPGSPTELNQPAAAPSEKQPDTLVDADYDAQEMQAAIKRARSELDAFIQVYQEGNGTGFAVKTAIVDGMETEHMWITNIRLEDGAFIGKIGNEPGMVHNVKFGQPWRVRKDEVSDWMYFRDQKMHGNYTMRPLLKTMPKDQADQLRSILANP